MSVFRTELRLLLGKQHLGNRFCSFESAPEYFVQAGLRSLPKAEPEALIHTVSSRRKRFSGFYRTHSLQRCNLFCENCSGWGNRTRCRAHSAVRWNRKMNRKDDSSGGFRAGTLRPKAFVLDQDTANPRLPRVLLVETALKGNRSLRKQKSPQTEPTLILQILKCQLNCSSLLGNTSLETNKKIYKHAVRDKRSKCNQRPM